MDWFNFLILLLLVAGHTELLVTLVNRVHSLRIHRDTLRHFRHLHDLLIPAFPLVLFWFVGIQGPGLLYGGSWADLSWGWSIYLGLCGLGVVGLLFSTVQHVLRRIPQAQLSNHSRTVDIEGELGYRPIGKGPFRSLARFPWNEAFRLEVSEKEYRLPRLPKEWDGLSILHLTDLHLVGTIDRPYFEKVIDEAVEQKADLIVFSGDLLDDSRRVDWLPDLLGRLEAPLGCYFILGNHDWYLNPESIRREMSRLGWIDVAETCVQIEHEGKPLLIAGTEAPWMGEHPDLSAGPAEAFRLLLSHTPDHFDWARQQDFDLMLSGHNHGGQVHLPVVGPVYSPSRYGCRYASGVFYREPTLLYVSRGISAKHPLRWRCLPELTKLVLRSEGRVD